MQSHRLRVLMKVSPLAALIQVCVALHTIAQNTAITGACGATCKHLLCDLKTLHNNMPHRRDERRRETKRKK